MMHQVLRPARGGRGVVPHRGSPERLTPGSPENDNGWHSPAVSQYLVQLLFSLVELFGK